jgi:ABC-type transport system involved in multi-copper enzyme maturation permease subunit
MKRAYELYVDELGNRRAVPLGFSWAGLGMSWVWMLMQRLWVEGLVTGVVNALLLGILYANRVPWGFYVALQAGLGIVVGLSARSLRELAAERSGLAYSCTVHARDAATAIAMLVQVGGKPLPEWRARRVGGVPDMAPVSWRGVLAMALLTLKAAFRYRLVVVLLAILVGAVFALPLIIKHDGTATGFSQILLAYTLTAITTLLGFSSLWLACGTLARDIEDMSLFLVVVKPIPRWQVWLGKWVGIMALNVGMVAIAGAIVYGLLHVRASQLPEAQLAKLRNEILVAREPVRANAIDLAAETEREFQKRRQDPTVAQMNPDFVRKQVRAQLEGRLQAVAPGQFRPVPFDFDLGPGARERFKGRMLYVRVKFFTPEYVGLDASFDHGWEAGGGKQTRPVRFSNNFGPDVPSEFEIPGELIDAEGRLSLRYMNLGKLTLVFPPDEGVQVLCPEAPFWVNFARGLCVILAWLGLLTAIGLFSASFLSFPVASFLSLALLVIGLSSGTLRQVVEQGGVVGINHETGVVSANSLVNQVAVQVYGGAYWVLSQVSGFSPVDALATGRSITWAELARAVALVVGVTGGGLAVAGMLILTRREIAMPT